MYELACVGIFLAAYLINATTISVFYHRGLAHRAVTLRPAVRRFAAHLGIWITGLDAKGWVCMHRMHHEYSDAPQDPHSPVHYGSVGVLRAQLRSYERTLRGLARRKPEYTRHVEDLDFPISAINRAGLWYLPYLLHLAIALAIALPTGMWALAAAYYAGMMSHPIEGWMVNWLGHAMGGRNFDTADNSRNNHLAAWLILGEGYQNNHHSHPRSASFAYRRSEIDLGYGLCLLLEKIGLLDIDRATLIRPAQRRRDAAAAYAGVRESVHDAIVEATR